MGKSHLLFILFVVSVSYSSIAKSRTKVKCDYSLPPESTYKSRSATFRAYTKCQKFVLLIIKPCKKSYRKVDEKCKFIKKKLDKFPSTRKKKKRSKKKSSKKCYYKFPPVTAFSNKTKTKAALKKCEKFYSEMKGCSRSNTSTASGICKFLKQKLDKFSSSTKKSRKPKRGRNILIPKRSSKNKKSKKCDYKSPKKTVFRDKIKTTVEFNKCQNFLKGMSGCSKKEVKKVSSRCNFMRKKLRKFSSPIKGRDKPKRSRKKSRTKRVLKSKSSKKCNFKFPKLTVYSNETKTKKEFKKCQKFLAGMKHCSKKKTTRVSDGCKFIKQKLDKFWSPPIKSAKLKSKREKAKKEKAIKEKAKKGIKFKCDYDLPPKTYFKSKDDLDEFRRSCRKHRKSAEFESSCSKKQYKALRNKCRSYKKLIKKEVLKIASANDCKFRPPMNKEIKSHEDAQKVILDFNIFIGKMKGAGCKGKAIAKAKKRLERTKLFYVKFEKQGFKFKEKRKHKWSNTPLKSLCKKKPPADAKYFKKNSICMLPTFKSIDWEKDNKSR